MITVGYDDDYLDDDISTASRASTQSQCQATPSSRSPEATTPALPHVLAQRNVRDASPTLLIIREPILSQALHVFLSGMVIPGSIDPSFKGHFTSLSNLLLRQPPRPEAAHFAAEAVALSSLSRRIQSSELQLQAVERYTISIQRLRATDLSVLPDTTSAIACIVLLGIYEIINADINGSFDWVQHLQGMIAVIKTLIRRGNLSLSGIPKLLLGTDPSSNLDNSNHRLFSLSPTTTSSLQPPIPYFANLCDILPKVQDLFQKSLSVLDPQSVRFEATLEEYRRDTIILKSALSSWSGSQPAALQKSTIQHFTQSYTLQFPGLEDFLCQTQRADIYNDYFVACMWLSCRQCQFHVIDLLDRINGVLSKDPVAYVRGRDHTKLRDEALDLVNDICASIPYMLMGNALVGTKPHGSTWPQTKHPLLAAGIHLQWIFFTVSILEIVPMSVRHDMKRNLLWLGTNLGIGQATVLAQMDNNLRGGITAKGDALRWAGFII